jgi:hypothetical protein
MRWTRDRHAHRSDLREASCCPHRNQISRSTVTMNGKVESCSNNQDEQDVNQYPKDQAVQVAAARRTGVKQTS